MKRLTQFVIVTGSLGALIVSGTGCGPSVKTKFNTYVQEWDNQIAQSRTVGSVENYVRMPSYRAIVELGPEALPLIWADIEANLPVSEVPTDPSNPQIPGGIPTAPPIQPAPDGLVQERKFNYLPPRTAALMFAAAEINKIDLREATHDVGGYESVLDTEPFIPPYSDGLLQEYLLKRLKVRLGK